MIPENLDELIFLSLTFPCLLAFVLFLFPCYVVFACCFFLISTWQDFSSLSSLPWTGGNAKGDIAPSCSSGPLVPPEFISVSIIRNILLLTETSGGAKMPWLPNMEGWMDPQLARRAFKSSQLDRRPPISSQPLPPEPVELGTSQLL